MEVQEFEDMPRGVSDGVYEPQLKQLVDRTRELCGQALLRMIAYAEPPAAPSEAGIDPVPERTEYDPPEFWEEWRDVLDDPACDRVLRLIRERVAEDVSLPAIVMALVLNWERASGTDKVELLNEAMGLDAPKLECHTLLTEDTNEKEI